MIIRYLLILRQQPGNPLPNATSTPLQGESEDSIGTPPCILLVVDDISDGSVHVYSGHPLTQPFALHLLGGHSPHLHAQTERSFIWFYLFLGGNYKHAQTCPSSLVLPHKQYKHVNYSRAMPHKLNLLQLGSGRRTIADHIVTLQTTARFPGCKETRVTTLTLTRQNFPCSPALACRS